MARTARQLSDMPAAAPIAEPAADRSFDAAAGQVGAWHDLIEQKLGAQRAHADIYGQPDGVERFVSSLSRAAGPIAYAAGVAGIIVWVF